MDLSEYVERIHRHFAAAAEAGGDEAKALAERLFAPLEAAIRLTLQEVLAAAAEEITCELAPGSVELRLRGRDPEFVVTAPDQPASGDEDPGLDPDPDPELMTHHDEGGVARINLRLPEHLKVRVEGAATEEGLSVNSWLVRAAAAFLERRRPPRSRGWHQPQGAQRYTGWGR